MSFSVSATPQWVLHPKHSTDRASALSRALSAPMPLGHALVNRGILTAEAADHFFHPALENLHEPAELLGLEAAAERILGGIAAGEKVFVQGDYDVDGITSTYLLYSALVELGARAEYHIPNRLRDGYGLTEAAVDQAKARGCSLVVTVDCGITAVEAVAHARTQGIDVVITDHHEPPAVLPKAAAIVNPLQPGCPYPFKSLAGVGVTFKLVERLLRGRGGIESAQRYLHAVALGTIADVVPLVGENRILARLGLEVLNQDAPLGLRALIRRVKLGDAHRQHKINSGHVAFVLAPRLNAAGRMGDAEEALRLLLARQQEEAESLADSLEETNKARRDTNLKVYKQAQAMVGEQTGYPDCHSILLWSEQWHSGVIGIVASRLVEEFQRPTMLVSIDHGRGRGSGRSLPGIDLTRLLDGCSDLLQAHGGHAFAAGLSVAPENLPALRERFERLVAEKCGTEQFVQRLEIDADLHAGECDMNLVDWLERMAPHGLGNPEPLFRLRAARIESVQRVGEEGKHLRLRAADDTGRVEAIGFGLGRHAEELEAARVADLAFVPTRNEYQGRESVQLKLKGVMVP